MSYGFGYNAVVCISLLYKKNTLYITNHKLLLEYDNNYLKNHINNNFWWSLLLTNHKYYKSLLLIIRLSFYEARMKSLGNHIVSIITHSLLLHITNSKNHTPYQILIHNHQLKIVKIKLFKNTLLQCLSCFTCVPYPSSTLTDWRRWLGCKSKTT